MSSSSPRIFGWSPSSPEGDIVDIPPSQAVGQFTFKLTPPRPDSAPTSSTSEAAPSPALTASTPSLFMEGGSLTSQQSEPEKIPRPPNAFIVFRTEFAHLHHNPQVSRSRRGNGAKVLGRTVSGKAADAWRLLSPEEKRHYVRLADLEKEKHARKHPNYQYRPKRRENAARRPAPSTPKRRRPSPTLTIRTSQDSASSSETLPVSPPAELPPSSPEIETKPVVDPSVKANRRRSTSVPVTSGEHLYTATLWGSEEWARERWEQPVERWEQPVRSRRRSRSVNQDWMSLAPSFPTPEPAFFDPRSPQNSIFSPSLNPTPFRVASPNVQTFGTLVPTSVFSPQRMSPLTAVASSLAAWNGDSGIPPTMPTVAPQPLRLHSPAWLSSPLAENRYDSSPEFDSKGPMTPLTSDFQWPLEPAAQYFFGVDPGPSVTSSSSQGKLDAVLMADYTRVEALQEYELGLHERVHMPDAAADFALFGLDPADELRYSAADELRY